MNRVLLENYYLPGQLEARLAEFVDYYNPWCHHESLRNLTRLRSEHSETEGYHQMKDYRVTTPAAPLEKSSGDKFNFNPDEADLLLNLSLTCPKGSDDKQVIQKEFVIFPTQKAPTSLLLDTFRDPWVSL